jgi:hypothetical protein
MKALYEADRERRGTTVEPYARQLNYRRAPSSATENSKSFLHIASTNVM